MKITSTALSLNVADTDASADFAKTHFGFTEAMADDGFVSLNHPDAGVNVVFLRTGLGDVQARLRRRSGRSRLAHCIRGRRCRRRVRPHRC